MKKSKLIVDYSENEELIGLVSLEKEYKLAWYLNNALSIKLVKDKDICLQFLDNKNLYISNFKFLQKFTSIWLLKNKVVESNDENILFLLPELKEFDYFLMIRSEESVSLAPNILDKIKELPFIHFYKAISIDKLKSKDNLIF